MTLAVETEEKIRELSTIFALNVRDIADGALFIEKTAEVAKAAQERSARGYELEAELAKDLDLTAHTVGFCSEILAVAQKHGSDAANDMVELMPFYIAFMQEIGRASPEGTCPTEAVWKETIDKVRKDFSL